MQSRKFRDRQECLSYFFSAFKKLARAARTRTFSLVNQSSSNDKSRRRPAARKAAKAAKGTGATGILGIGLDNEDGHKRVTTAEQFAIVGGSEETHGRMTETLVKTFEELKHRGKHLAQVERAELAEIIHKSTPR